MIRFRRSINGIIGLVMVIVIVGLSAFAPLLAINDPNIMDTSVILESPSASHPFGTDDLGRDVFSRVLYGGRISILVALIVGGITSVLGLAFGMLSGFYQRLDNPIMRVMDLVMAFPSIILALAIVAILGPRFVNIVLALIVPYTPLAARVVRGTILQLKRKEFVLAARASGASDFRIMVRYLLPNTLPQLLVQETYIVAISILAVAYLSFLGVGVPPTTPTLGAIISDARPYLRNAPWLSLFPGLAISILVLGINLLGDGLRDTLDPRMRM